MMIACFLPWVEVNSSASYMGYSSSFHASSSGMMSGVGIIPFSISIVCALLVVIKSKFMLIPGMFNLLFAIMELSGLINVSASVSFSFGEGHSNPSYGIFVLLLGSIGYISSTFSYLKNLNGIRENKIEVSQTAQVNRPIIDAKSLKRTGLVLLVSAIIIFLGVEGFNWYQNYKDEKATDAREFQYEIERLENKKQLVESLININELNNALANIDQIKWEFKPEENIEQVRKYDLEREKLHKSISIMIEARDVANAAAAADFLTTLRPIGIGLQEANDSLYKDSLSEHNFESEFPFSGMIISEKSFFYNEPNYNADRNNQIIKGDTVIVTARQDKFIYCKNKKDDKVGWIPYDDVTRLIK